MVYDTLAKRLLEIRRNAGMSQRALAKAALINLAPLQRLENGAAEPRWSTLVNLAYALSVPLGELAGYLAGELPPEKFLKKIRKSA